MKTKKESKRTIVIGLFYLAIFLLLMVSAVFFKQYYWYLLVVVVIMALVVSKYYSTRKKTGFKRFFGRLRTRKTAQKLKNESKRGWE